MKLRKQDILILAALTGLCLCTRLFWYTGVYLNDDLQYIDHAEALVKGFNIWADGGSQLAFRLGMVLPLALACRLLGYHEHIFTIYPILCSLGACIFIFLAAFRLWGLTAAVLSSVAWILFPLQVCYDTTLSTSSQLALCASAAFLAFVEAQRLEQEEADPAAARKVPLLYLLCGVMIGMGWLVSALFVLAVFIALPIIAFMRPPLRAVGLVLAGFLVIFTLEIAFYSVSSDHPFARIISISTTEEIIDSNRQAEYLPRSLFRVSDPNYFYHEGHFGFQWYFFIALTLYAFLAKERVCRALTAGVWCVVAYIQFGVISPDLTPITKYIRYLSLITPFMCLVTGWAFSRGFTHPSPSWSIVARAFFFVYCAHCVMVIVPVIDKNRISLRDFREPYRIIVTDHLPTPVYADNMARHYYDLYSGKKLKVTDVEEIITAPPPEHGTVVQGSSCMMFNREYREAHTPPWYRVPPPHWTLYREILPLRNYALQTFPRVYIINKP